MKLDGPRPGEVLVRLSSCGICGTDRGCIHGAEPVLTPLVLGHEGAGINYTTPLAFSVAAG